MKLRFIPLPTDQVRNLQQGGLDANGQRPETQISKGTGECRHCLSLIPKGEDMLVLAYRPFTTLQPYAEVGPIFLCAKMCNPHTASADLPVIAVKQRLQQSTDLLTVAEDSGLSGVGRLHELMVSCEGMSTGEIKSGGAGLDIHHGTMPTPFGDAQVGWTERGICYLHFVMDDKSPEQALLERWPAAKIIADEDGALDLGNSIFHNTGKPRNFHLLLKC